MGRVTGRQEVCMGFAKLVGRNNSETIFGLHDEILTGRAMSREYRGAGNNMEAVGSASTNRHGFFLNSGNRMVAVLGTRSLVSSPYLRCVVYLD